MAATVCLCCLGVSLQRQAVGCNYPFNTISQVGPVLGCLMRVAGPVPRFEDRRCCTRGCSLCAAAEVVDSLAPNGLLFMLSGYALSCFLWRPMFVCSTLMDLSSTLMDLRRWQAGGRTQHHRQPS